MHAYNVNWISGEPQIKEKQYTVKIRYCSKLVLASIKTVGDSDALEIKLQKRLRDITSGHMQYSIIAMLLSLEGKSPIIEL